MDCVERDFDVAIIGAGPAGLTAAIYALRSGQSVGIFEKNTLGGQVSLTYDIKNYPGFEQITGMELALKMHEQATNLGAKTIYGEVDKLNISPMNNILFVKDKSYTAKVVILALGAKSRTLGVEGEQELTGKGVGYCAICDGALYKGKDVVLVGGGNSAVEEAIYLSNICKSVTLINNLPHFTCQEQLLKEFNSILDDNKNITILHNSMVTKIVGEKQVESVEIVSNGENKTLKVDGVFVAIGRVPDTDLVRNHINLERRGYIPTTEKMETNVESIYACGDVRVKDVKQIITACADGAIAAVNANLFIRLHCNK